MFTVDSTYIKIVEPLRIAQRPKADFHQYKSHSMTRSRKLSKKFKIIKLINTLERVESFDINKLCASCSGLSNVLIEENAPTLGRFTTSSLPKTYLPKLFN